MSRTGTNALCALFAIAISSWLFLDKKEGDALAKPNRYPIHIEIAKERKVADKMYAARDFKKAETSYREFIEKHKGSPDPHVQNEVGAARIRLGFTLTKSNDWQSARKAFLEAKEEFRGTDSMRADFGGILDQAAYQAAVCLEADGKEQEARNAYRRFFREHALSPLVHGVFRRIERLNGGNADPQDEALLQQAVSAQDKHIRIETAVCGPKAIAYFLSLLGKPATDYKALAKLCRTDESGTSMKGMQEGLASCGVRVEGLLLNRKDFAKLRLPAIWLVGEHYLVITQIEPTHCIAYNPVYRSERKMPLPPMEDSAFSATVLQMLNPSSMRVSLP